MITENREIMKRATLIRGHHKYMDERRCATRRGKKVTTQV